ncbi:MAG TPA: hypothetical protein VF812_14595 [Ktedonobacterales bacterium]
MYRPGGSSANNSQGYVPGGGGSQQPPSNDPPDLPPQRPMGSLQRRLQRSQASIPGDDFEDRDWGQDDRAGRGASRRSSDGQGHDDRGSRRMSGDDYGARGRRSRPIDEQPQRRGSRTSGGRPRDDFGEYSDHSRYDESREEPAYARRSGYGASPDESREYPTWDASREEPAYDPPRRHRSSDRRRPMDESAEMSAEGPAYPMPRRSTPGRRSPSMNDPRGDWDDYAKPLDDPRAPPRGAPGRRPSSGQRSQRRPADDYAGYTEGEMGAQGYPGYRDDSNGRGGRNDAPRRTGSRGGREAGYAAPVEIDDDYASRENWAAPAGYDAFENSGEQWRPGAASARYDQPPARRGAAGASGGRQGERSSGRSAGKRKGSPLKTVFSLLVTLAVVAAIGVELGPKVYHLALNRGLGGGSGSQGTATCATEATPSSQMKVATGTTAFATTAYTLAYPSTWQKNAQSGASQSQCDVVFLFSQPNGAAKLNIEQAGAFASLSDLQVIAAEAQSAQQQGTSFSEITSAATSQNIGGEVWQRREYQATTQNGVKLHLAMLATHHKGAGYAIVMLSSDSGFASDDTTTFEPMLHSFQFV